MEAAKLLRSQKMISQFEYKTLLQLERSRLDYAVSAQIEILKDRINDPSGTAQVKQAWTIAILELLEVKKAINLTIETKGKQ